MIKLQSLKNDRSTDTAGSLPILWNFSHRKVVVKCMGKVKDKTGQRFGKLLVIGFSHLSNHASWWHCRCDCGNEKITVITPGKTKSCGCLLRIKRKPRIDLSGERFGRLTVECFSHRSSGGDAMWKCKCDCGNEKVILGANLKSGVSKSCGCLRIELMTTHGTSHLKERETWRKMILRCEDEKDQAYPDYGGRGIRVCDRWHIFEDFYADMGSKPSPKHSLDRIDNSKGYSPDNCRWATKIEQVNNRRNTKMITYQGRTQSLHDWAREKGIVADTLLDRYEKGYLEEDLFKPLSQGTKKFIRKVRSQVSKND